MASNRNESRITPTTSIVKVYGYTILIGVGVGSYAQASYPVSQCMVQPENMANVIAFMGIGLSQGTFSLSPRDLD